MTNPEFKLSLCMGPLYSEKGQGLKCYRLLAGRQYPTGLVPFYIPNRWGTWAKGSESWSEGGGGELSPFGVIWPEEVSPPRVQKVNSATAWEKLAQDPVRRRACRQSLFRL